MGISLQCHLSDKRVVLLMDCSVSDAHNVAASLVIGNAWLFLICMYNAKEMVKRKESTDA